MHAHAQIDFRRGVEGEVGTVERLEYDPNRSTRIALVRYPEGAHPLPPALMSETPLCMPACYQYLSGTGSPSMTTHLWEQWA